MTSRAFLRLCLLTLLGFLAAADPARAERAYGQEEYVIASGGPALRAWEEYRGPGDQHDRYWGNFIRAARIRIDQLRAEHGPALNVTWLVYRPSYESREREDVAKRPQYLCTLAEISTLAAERKVRLVWFRDTAFLIGYLNDFRVMMICSLVLIPLLFLMRRPALIAARSPRYTAAWDELRKAARSPRPRLRSSWCGRSWARTSAWRRAPC